MAAVGLWPRLRAADVRRPALRDVENAATSFADLPSPPNTQLLLCARIDGSTRRVSHPSGAPTERSIGQTRRVSRREGTLAPANGDSLNAHFLRGSRHVVLKSYARGAVEGVAGEGGLFFVDPGPLPIDALFGHGFEALVH